MKQRHRTRTQHYTLDWNPYYRDSYLETPFILDTLYTRDSYPDTYKTPITDTPLTGHSLTIGIPYPDTPYIRDCTNPLYLTPILG